MTEQVPTFEEALFDVEARFLYNLPENEINQTDRLFFQIEQAYWYYEDFKADRYPSLPHFKNLKGFAVRIFEHCELLKGKTNQFTKLFSDFTSYKSKIPVCGCILLNPDLSKVLLICNWNNESWTFPRGKINENENEFDCALREVNEEIGFNATPYCNPEDYMVVFQDEKKIQLFIGTNVPEDTAFATKTRKEVSKIEFFPLNALPSSTYHVLPFIPKLKRWIAQKNKANKKKLQQSPRLQAMQLTPGRVRIKTRTPNDTTENKSAFQPIANNDTTGKSPGRKIRNPFDSRNDATFEMQQAANKGWTVQDMFKANAAITGKDYNYDGNPHDFGASHPKYVNYSVGAEVRGRSLLTASPEVEVAFTQLSMQSAKQGEAMLRGRHVDLDEMPEFRLPRSVADMPGRRLFRSFAYDAGAVLDAFDQALLAANSGSKSSKAN
ncbi:NUDIX domain-containing protein [archaeon]|nr:MAG: NUDIX domain-containing protein [archaeon]